MIIKQLSVFVENKKGRLKDIADTLANEDIDISALSLADTAEFGVLRLIVDKTDEAKEALRKIGVIVKVTNVLAVVAEDVPGGMAKVLSGLSDNGISIEYMYACIGKTSGKAFMVLRPDDIDMADEILQRSDFGLVNPADIYRL